MSKTSVNKTQASEWGGRIWMGMLGLSLCAMGFAGCTFLWLSFQKARSTDHWVERPAKVIVSMVDHSRRTQHNDVKFQLQLHYRYEFEGKSHLSSKIKVRPIASKVEKKIVAWQRLYPVGKELICYVNPEQADQAILIKPTKAAIYSLWFPAILILFGIRLISGIFSTKPREKV
ncbi:MAG: DUF3592 domain-containing protein [Verrucomicrobiales bacterium]|nr:DUF3592 domain-containing protein [Verrucomicrobiales bacterium]